MMSHPPLSMIIDKRVDIVIREASFCRVFIGTDQLNVEMINDVPSQIGAIVVHPEHGKLDSRENILANKVTALVDRAHPKDVVDIYYLLREGLSLKQALPDAASKAAGITPLLVACILGEFPYERLDSVNWMSPVESATIQVFLTEVAQCLIEGKGI